MKKALLLLLCTLGCTMAFGQKNSPQITPYKCKVYYGYDKPIKLELKTEYGPWLSWSMARGIHSLSLNDCGKPQNQICNKYLRVCTKMKDNTTDCEVQKLEGKTRYQVVWDNYLSKWFIRKKI